LSGGEKAVQCKTTSQALSIVMDETNASLDKLTLRSAAWTFRDLANDTQIVSISLSHSRIEHLTSQSSWNQAL
jgi:energy-coupling factor transporter ATP-binding protein EcfA2